jgi:glycosyltransferase involved in cell wall biosynthesis
MIGYLARVCPEKGLHDLVEAFHLLAGRVGTEQVRLRVAGYLGERDRDYYERVQEQVRHWGLEDKVDFLGEIDRAEKIDFLDSLHVLSVPTTYREPKGLFVLEALASGVPVVQPEHGAFPEMVAATGGGLLVEPGDVGALAAALQSLMEDPERREGLAKSGREAVRRDWNNRTMADETLALYRRYVSGVNEPRVE